MQSVALLTDGIWPLMMGGMQKHSYYMAKYLSKMGINVTVFYIKIEKNNIKIEDFFTKEELNHISFCEIEFPKLKISFPGHYLFESYLYSKYIFQKLIKNLSNYDLIYAQGFTGWYLLNYKKNQKLMPPVAVNFHGLEMFQKAPNFIIKLQHLMLRQFVIKNFKKSDMIISLGGKLTNIVEKYSKNIHVIPIGIENNWLNVKNELYNEIIRFVFIGRFERRKGIEELTKALKKIDNSFYFDFIGPIPVQHRINDSRIHYHGQIQDEETIKNFLCDADILVCPSWSEGMPTVILEAMASGCAIIATNVGAVSEQVDEKNGILIEPGNINTLTNALIQFINLDKDKLLEMKKNSIEKIKQKFLWEQVIEKTIKELKIQK